jgi:hypothetical protein
MLDGSEYIITRAEPHESNPRKRKERTRQTALTTLLLHYISPRLKQLYPHQQHISAKREAIRPMSLQPYTYKQLYNYTSIPIFLVATLTSFPIIHPSIHSVLDRIRFINHTPQYSPRLQGPIKPT